MARPPTNRKLKAARNAVDQAFQGYERALKSEGLAEADLELAKQKRYDATNLLHKCLRERELQVRADERNLVASRQPKPKAPASK